MSLADGKRPRGCLSDPPEGWDIVYPDVPFDAGEPPDKLRLKKANFKNLLKREPEGFSKVFEGKNWKALQGLDIPKAIAACVAHMRTRGKLKMPKKWTSAKDGRTKAAWNLKTQEEQQEEIENWSRRGRMIAKRKVYRVNNALARVKTCFRGVASTDNILKQLKLPMQPPKEMVLLFLYGRGESNPNGGRQAKKRYRSPKQELYVYCRSKEKLAQFAALIYQAAMPDKATAEFNQSYNVHFFHNEDDMKREFSAKEAERKRAPYRRNNRTIADVVESFPSENEPIELGRSNIGDLEESFENGIALEDVDETRNWEDIGDDEDDEDDEEDDDDDDEDDEDSSEVVQSVESV
jgi:hypothetical protein